MFDNKHPLWSSMFTKVLRLYLKHHKRHYTSHQFWHGHKWKCSEFVDSVQSLLQHYFQRQSIQKSTIRFPKLSNFNMRNHAYISLSTLGNSHHLTHHERHLLQCHYAPGQTVSTSNHFHQIITFHWWLNTHQFHKSSQHSKHTATLAFYFLWIRYLCMGFLPVFVTGIFISDQLWISHTQ